MRRARLVTTWNSISTLCTFPICRAAVLHKGASDAGFKRRAAQIENRVYRARGGRYRRGCGAVLALGRIAEGPLRRTAEFVEGVASQDQASGTAAWAGQKDRYCQESD